jgi:hypothetical protein
VVIAVGHQTDEDIQREVLLELKWDASKKRAAEARHYG